MAWEAVLADGVDTINLFLSRYLNKQMNLMKNQSRHENMMYLVVWGLLFLAPLLSLYVRTINHEDATFNWTEVLIVWRSFAIFLVLFLLHNCFLAPLIVHQQRRVLYFSVVTAVLGAFFIWQCSHKPQRDKDFRKRPPMERHESRPPHMDENGEHQPPFDKPPHDKPEHRMRRDHMPPPIVGERDILALVVLILMFGANLGTKYYFRSRDDQKRLAELERQNLEQQLEYLRYQINPHFFMNTLNNIHALVDIDPEQAKDSIVDMSRMMRYLLYDSDKAYVPLNQAVAFLKKHLNLMKLRYTDMVTVNLNVPKTCSENIVIAPLLFLPFVENAFKHGVAIDKPSTIDIDIECKDDRLLFHCHNTKSGVKHEYGGVGLSNVSKRLELIYGNDYSLNINDGEKEYDVLLDLPAKTPEDFKELEVRS